MTPREVSGRRYFYLHAATNKSSRLHLGPSFLSMPILCNRRLLLLSSTPLPSPTKFLFRAGANPCNTTRFWLVANFVQIPCIIGLQRSARHFASSFYNHLQSLRPGAYHRYEFLFGIVLNTHHRSFVRLELGIEREAHWRYTT